MSFYLTEVCSLRSRGREPFSAVRFDEDEKKIYGSTLSGKLVTFTLGERERQRKKAKKCTKKA
jgi:hypothetical protein